MPNREKIIDELNTDVLPFLQHHCDMQCDREKRWISKMIITVHDALDLLKEQEAVEPKTGHWIYKEYDDMFMCSCCEKYSIRNDYPYCHWCGAKMDMDDEVDWR